MAKGKICEKVPRRNRMTKKSMHKWCALVLLGAFVLAPCVGWAHTAQNPDKSDLIAGQDFDNPAGKVFIWNDDENLYVKFQVYSPPWYMTETAVNVDIVPPSPPISPGGFTSKHPSPNNPEDLHTILLSSLPFPVEPGDLVYIMAHAVVDNLVTGVSGETAWKEGTEIEGPGAGWAMYNEYEIQEESWLEVTISETHLTWDVFKPRRFASLGPVLTIASNGTVIVLYETSDPDRAPGPAERERSLLVKIPSNPGTSPDEITLWATGVWGEPSSPHETDPNLLPHPDDWSNNPENLFTHWIEFLYLEGYQMQLLKSEKLENGRAFSLYNMINVDPCDSEGHYFEQFAVTITVEP